LDAFDAKHKIIYVDDLISYIEDEIEWVPEISFEEFLEDHPVKDYSYCEDLIYEILDSYETGNIVRAIESEKEIMISCDKYILIKDVNDVGDKIVE